jgi:hypothetical protein
MRLQNIHSKWVAAKILVINGLAPESVRGFLGFDLYIQYSGLSPTKMQTDVVVWQ